MEREDLLTYEWNYKNTYNPDQGLERFDDLKNFEKYVCNVGNNFLSSLGYDPKDSLRRAFIFTSEITRGNFHAPHAHPNCVLSGVFYLQVPENSSRIIFHDPRPFRKYRIIPFKKQKEAHTTIFESEVFISPKPGLLLMWESWLDHEIEISNSDESRITLVFNLY